MQNGATALGADTVFISYSHDSPEHSARVLALSDKLRDLGVDAEIDQYHTRPPQGWPHWCEERLRPENSKYVLTVCTPTYRSRVENKAPADEGRGVYWEGSVVYQYIYDDKTNKRFIPILLGHEADNESIPIRLRGFTSYVLRQFNLEDSGFEALYRELTDQPAVIKRGLGDKVVLAPRSPAGPVVAAPLPERQALSTFEPPSLQRVGISANAPEQAETQSNMLTSFIEQRGSVIATRVVIAMIGLLIGLLIFFETWDFGWTIPGVHHILA